MSTMCVELLLVFCVFVENFWFEIGGQNGISNNKIECATHNE